MSRLGHVCVAAALRVHVEDAGCGGALAHVTPAARRPVPHAQRPVGRMGDGCVGDVHAVFHAPGRLGLAAVQLALEAQAVVIPPQVRGEMQGAAEEAGLGPGRRVSVPRHEDDDMQGVRAFLGQPWDLLAAGLAVAVHGRGVELLLRHAAVIQLATVEARGTTTRLQAGVGPGPGRVGAPCGDAVHRARSRPVHGMVVANGPIPHHVWHRDRRHHPWPHGGDQAVARPQRRGEGNVGRGFVRPALGTSAATLAGGRWLRLGGRCGLTGRLLRVPAPHRRDRPRQHAPCLGPDPRSGEAGQPWHGRAVQTGKAPLQPMGVWPRLRDHDCIASHERDLSWPVQRLPPEHPNQRGPGPHRGANTWHGPITAPWPSPPGQAQPGAAAGHDQQSQGHPVAWAQGGHRHLGSEAVEPC